MPLVINPSQANSTIFQKCGEITTAIEVGKKTFALNCIFCTAVCLQLESFALHVEENHHNVVYIDVATEGDDSSNEQQFSNTVLQSDQLSPLSIDLKFEDILKSKKDKCLEFDDPLLEAPMSINPMELPTCVINVKKEDEYKEMKDEHSDEEMDELYDVARPADDGNSSTAESTCDIHNDSDDDYEDVDDNEDNINNKNLLLALIEGYEKYDILWESDCPTTKNRKKHEYALEMIAQSIKTKLKITLNAKAISKRLNKIRSKYYAELQTQKHAESFSEIYDKPWYFDKLAFLNKTTYKPRNKRGTKALANEKPALPLPNLTDAQNIELIEIYKSFPCLWDMQHIGFRFKVQRTEALDEMIQTVKNTLNLNLTHDEMQKKLYRIRYACTQEKHRKLQCERIQKEFKPSSSYFERIAFLVDNVGPFKCDFCEETFNGADQYRIHKSKHDGSMPFVCPICNRGFMKVGNCTVHVRRHTRDYPFECEVCGKRFATTTDVNVHMRYHTGEKPYFCEVCGQSFRTWSFFDAHMRRHQKRPSHKCTICSKSFYENNKLTEHMKAHLNVRDKVCNICDKAFTSSKYLRQHKQIHAEKKKYVCKICDKGFAQYAGLSGHMKSHGTTVSGSAVVEENKKKKIKNEITGAIN